MWSHDGGSRCCPMRLGILVYIVHRKFAHCRYNLLSTIIEILLIIVCLVVVGGINVLKTRLSNQVKLYLSILAGLPLVIWAWLNTETFIFWKITMSIVVLYAILKNLHTIRLEKSRNAES